MARKQKILPTSNERAAYLNALGCQKLLSGQKRGALRDFKRADRLVDQGAELLFERAKAYLALGDPKSVIALMQKALALDPNQARLYHLKGLAESSFKKSYPLLAQSVSTLKRAQELGASCAWDLALALRHLGDLTGEAIEYAQAIDLFETELARYSDNSRFLLDFFETRMALCRKIASEGSLLDALSKVKKVRKLEPNLSLDEAFARVYHRLFELTGKMTYFNLANTHFSAASLADPRPERFLSWANLLKTATISRRDPLFLSMGLKKYARAVELNPGSLEYALAYVASVAYYSLITETIEELPKAAELLAAFREKKEPGLNAEFSYAEALCKTALGYFHSSPEFFQQAMPLFSEAIAKRPCHALYWHGAGICMLGLSYIPNYAGNIEKALHCFERAAEFDDNLDYAIDVAFATLRQAQMEGRGDLLDRSIQLFESALAKTKERKTEWIFHYGCALRYKGEMHQSPTLLSDATRLLSQLEREASFASMVHFEIGLAAAMIGEIEGSRTDFKRAISHFEIVMRSDIENERAFCESALAEMNLAHLSHEDNAPFYKRAEQRLIHAARLGSLHALYYLGCLYALSHMPEKALTYLQRAKEYGALPPPEQMEGDSWLDAIRHLDGYKRLIEE